MSTPIHSRRGQTLVEALVALSILTMGTIGIITLLTKSFQLNRTVANDTQATYLAAEGIELTKNMIDHDVYAGFALGPGDYLFGNCFKNQPRLVYLNGLDYTTQDCTGVSFSPPPPGGDQLYFDPATHLYSFEAGGGTLSNFTRDVTAQEKFDASTGQPADIDVRSTVTWSDGALSNTITLEDYFYNWHP
jgi:hypothetical protein